MKYFYNLFVKSILNFSFTIGFTFLIACNVGCFSINTIGQVGGSVLEELGDVNIFSDEEELTIGKAFDEQHAKEVKFYTDPVVTSYINNLGQTLVKQSKRKNIRYTFRVVDSKEINAYAVPGGFIYVNLGLIRAVRTESELAFVIGHEIGHIVGRHSMKRLTQAYGFEILKQIILDEDSSELTKLVSDILTAGILFKYSRDNERESDFYGINNVYDIGISPEGGINFFETLQKLQKREPTKLENLISTHPVHSERISNVRSQINGLPPKSNLKTNSSRFQQVKQRIR